jgi:hypothetical protein
MNSNYLNCDCSRAEALRDGQLHDISRVKPGINCHFSAPTAISRWRWQAIEPPCLGKGISSPVGRLGKTSDKMISDLRSLSQAPFGRYSPCVKDYSTTRLNRHKPQARFESRQTERLTEASRPEAATLNLHRAKPSDGGFRF